MRCPQCRGTDLIELELAPKGEPLHFSQCRNCEHRWWQSVDDMIDITDVLSRVAAA